MAFSLTTEQQAAVDNRGGGLLVSAAAGSGKTRVLVERLLARVTGEGLDIDRFLVITYTKAAAAELRGRIVEELSARLAEHPTDAHLRRQATLVYKAQISTVHAFCAQLLRECGHLLDLDPDFRLCDEGEAGILMLRALNDVLERRYENIVPGSDFAQLVDTMAAGRDDSRLMQIVLDIRGRVQAHPNPAAWLDEQEKTFTVDGLSDPAHTPWGRLLLDDAARQGAYWRGKIAVALELCPCDANLDANYGLRRRRVGTRPAPSCPSRSPRRGGRRSWTAPMRRRRSSASAPPARSGWTSSPAGSRTAGRICWRISGPSTRQCGVCSPW